MNEKDKHTLIGNQVIGTTHTMKKKKKQRIFAALYTHCKFVHLKRKKNVW